MKALLICPDFPPAVALLAESCPLAVAPLLGRCLVEYWIEHLVALGAKEILLVASDRPDLIRLRVGDGTRWGVPVTYATESREPTPEQAAARYRLPNDAPTGVVLRMDHLPGQPGLPLFSSYAAWFRGLSAWIPRAQALERIGQCEVRPGVWVGLRTRIHPTARLLAPCWLGDYVTVHAGAVIGPGTVLDDGVVVAAGAQIRHSVIGPSTFVGVQTRVEDSIVHHHTLINWVTGSCLRVADAFWLSSLHAPLTPPRSTGRLLPMKIENNGHRLSVSKIGELSAGNSAQFREEVLAAFTSLLTTIEIDLSQTRFVDSSGLASLYDLHRSAIGLGISVQLLHPEPSVRQLLELTRMKQHFGVDQAGPARPGQPLAAPVRLTPAFAH